MAGRGRDRKSSDLPTSVHALHPFRVTCWQPFSVQPCQLKLARLFKLTHVDVKYYNPFSQAMSKCRTLILLLKKCVWRKGSTHGLLSALFLSWSELSSVISTGRFSPTIPIPPLSFLPHPEPQKQTFYLLPTFSLGQGMCFSRASSSSRCWTTFQINQGLDPTV